jgi:hypothetical protein
MLLDGNEMVITRILMAVVVARVFFHRGGQAPVGMNAEEMQGGCAQAQRKEGHGNPPKRCVHRFSAQNLLKTHILPKRRPRGKIPPSAGLHT